MKTFRLLLASLVLFLVHTTASADVNVLIVGSTSDGGDRFGGKSDPFDPTNIATELESILSGANLGTANVVVEERYATGLDDFGSSYSYNLASWYHWPYPAGVETSTRWPNLRGENGTQWDYVVLIGDPYTMENLPGHYAHGVEMIAQEVAKGSGETVLLMPWPVQGNNDTSVDHYKELVYRAGRTGGYKVAPAALAWQADGSPTGTSHPSARGAYICAASIYSRIWGQSATNSTYNYDDALADDVNAIVTTNVNKADQYTGYKMDFQNPWLMLGDKRREVWYSEKGSSTESYYANRLRGIIPLAGVAYNDSLRDSYYDNNPGWTGDHVPIAWNHGRDSGGSRSYVVNPDYWQLAFTFNFQLKSYDWADDEANDFTLARIYSHEVNQARGLISEGPTVRNAAWRLMWGQFHQKHPTVEPVRDNSWHVAKPTESAVGAFMYTLYSGRCPVNPGDTGEHADARMIGYQTAWRLGTCSSRAPGFKVIPSSVSAVSLTPGATETMNVQFLFSPRQDVVVTVTSSDPSVGLVGTPKLLFTPSNYNVPQTVKVMGVPGSPSGAAVDIAFNTESDDEAYHGLSDSWRYSNNRSDTPVSHTDHSDIFDTYKNFPIDVALNASGASAANTTFADPKHGTLSWNGEDLTYTPNADYVGPDGFSYYCLNGTTLTTGSMTINVLDGFPDGSVRVEHTDSTASEEGTNTGSVTIVREGDASSTISVNFTLGGTATAVSDYNLDTSSPVEMAAGQSSVEIVLTPVDDNDYGEQTETAEFSIASGAGYIVVDGIATVSIVDNDNNVPEVNAGATRNVTLLVADPTQPLASGGTVSNYTINGTNYITHTFSTVGNNTLTFPRDYDVDYLIVAGGGGGGNGTGGRSKSAGGGGGAGGLLTSVGGSMLAVTEGAYSVTVGDGGAVNGSGTEGSNGGNSMLAGPGMTSITAIGGGGGGKGSGSDSAGNGGSGGGSGADATGPGTGTALQGNDGGLGANSGSTVHGGGGGGAGEAGNTDGGGDGGDGLMVNITGSDVWYAGGGASPDVNETSGYLRPNAGGLGGGGAGLADGTDGLGGGGSGGGFSSGELGGAGGSGVVIVRYTIPSAKVAVTLSDAEVIDADELDPAYPTWSLKTKPAGAPDPIFEDVNVIDATVTFMMPGIYVLRLEVNDGTVSDYGEVTITVDEPAPAADAGVDQTVIDNDENGSELVTLDGSGSSDLFDGSIVSYVWNDGTSDIASIATAEVALPVGTHTITLTVTDNDGLTATDTVVITVEAPNKLPVVSAGTDQFVPLEVAAPWTPEQWASGGTVTHYTLNGMNYTAHTFTTGGTLTFSNAFDVEYLIVAGGGGGGNGNVGTSKSAGGGGGAGGLLTNVGGSMLAVTEGAYTVTVGGGGAGADGLSQSGSNGGNSILAGPAITTITANGGGGGGSPNTPPGNGGSGGGGGADTSVVGDGTAGQGYDGGIGDSVGTTVNGGGGGGAGEAGNTDGAGDGGDGLMVNITGSGVFYAGGGESPNVNNSDGYKSANSGGLGGGGVALLDLGSGAGNGVDGLGGGGSGGGFGGGTTPGPFAGDGGSGIVIVRYSTGFTNGSAEVQFSGASATDPDGDDFDVSWEVVSTDPPGLPAPVFSGDVTLGTAAATFTAIGKYTLRLTADDGEDTRSSSVEVTIYAQLLGNYSVWTHGDFANPFTNTALDADPDGDGVSSLLEFAFGTDPTANDSRFMAADGSTHGQPMAASDESDGMWLYFLRRTDHGTAGSVTFSTEFSTDLGSFTPSSAGLVPADVQNASPGYEVMKIPYPDGSRFGRVAVEATPE